MTAVKKSTEVLRALKAHLANAQRHVDAAVDGIDRAFKRGKLRFPLTPKLARELAQNIYANNIAPKFYTSWFAILVECDAVIVEIELGAHDANELRRAADCADAGQAFVPAPFLSSLEKDK